VNAFGRQHSQSRVGLRQRLGVLRPHAGRNDDTPSAHLEFVAGLQVADDHPGDRGVLGSGHPHHLGPADRASTVLRRGAHQGDDQPGVVHSRVMELDRAVDPFESQVWRQLQRRLAAELTMRWQRAAPNRAGEQVENPDGGGGLGAFCSALPHRPEEGLRLDQMWGDAADQQPTLADRFGHKAEVAEV